MQQIGGTIKVPYPPSANRIWRYYRGRPTKSKDYRLWLDHSALLIQATWQHKTITAPVHIGFAVGVPDKRKRDLDNRLKPCLDLLEAAGVLENDHLVHSLAAAWDHNLKAEVLITIRRLTA